MTNRVHLLLTPRRAESVSRFVMALGRRYVQYINKTQGRAGALWDSRYKSSLIDAAAYLLSCQRYIEMNPVRGGMVDDPAHYRWSSYRHNALRQADELLTPHAVYKARHGRGHALQALLRAVSHATGSRPDQRHPAGATAEPTAGQQPLCR